MSHKDTRTHSILPDFLSSLSLDPLVYCLHIREQPLSAFCYCCNSSSPTAPSTPSCDFTSLHVSSPWQGRLLSTDVLTTLPPSPPQGSLGPHSLTQVPARTPRLPSALAQCPPKGGLQDSSSPGARQSGAWWSSPGLPLKEGLELRRNRKRYERETAQGKAAQAACSGREHRQKGGTCALA